MIISCPRCGHTFTTNARTNTRCRQCRQVVDVRRFVSGSAGSDDAQPAGWQAVEDTATAGLSPLPKALVGLLLLGGGGYAIAHGLKVAWAPAASEEADAVSSRDRAAPWYLWVAAGAALTGLGAWILWRTVDH